MCFDFFYNFLSEICVLIFSKTFCPKYLSLQEEFSEVWSKIYICLHVKYPLFLSDFNKTWIFLVTLSKNTQISNFMKIRPVGAELIHADGLADRHEEADSCFSQFFESSYKGNFNLSRHWVLKRSGCYTVWTGQ